MDISKDYYLILGCNRTATEREIRAAYLSKVKVIHPDRFSLNSQEWKKANEMLIELNEAYSILKDSVSRKEYDNICSNFEQTANSTYTHVNENTQNTVPPFESSDLTAGSVKFNDLPKYVQKKMLNRQKNVIQNQVRVKNGSVGGSYFWTGLLMLWFVYLYSVSQGPKWEVYSIFWYSTISVTACWFICSNIIKIFDK